MNIKDKGEEEEKEEEEIELIDHQEKKLLKEKKYILLDIEGYRLGPIFKFNTPGLAANMATIKGHNSIYLLNKTDNIFYYYEGILEPILEPNEFQLEKNIMNKPKVKMILKINLNDEVLNEFSEERNLDNLIYL